VFYYIATPYSKFPGGLEEAFKIACEQTALLLREGVPAYSPIAHTHPIAIYGNIDPLDHDLWMRVDVPMMASAYGLIVVEMDGWRESRGVAAEIKTFRAAGKPVTHMTPGIVPDGLWRNVPTSISTGNED
jgi:hypothetical protein